MKLRNTYYLIRHGESLVNILNKGSSVDDPANHLTSRGIEEVEKCAKVLASKNIQFEKIISSPFLRTQETAEIILTHLPVNDKKILYLSLLKEMDPRKKMSLMGKMFHLMMNYTEFTGMANVFGM